MLFPHALRAAGLFPFYRTKEFPQHLRRYEVSYRDGAYLKGKVSGQDGFHVKYDQGAGWHPVKRSAEEL